MSEFEGVSEVRTLLVSESEVLTLSVSESVSEVEKISLTGSVSDVTEHLVLESESASDTDSDIS